MKVENTCSGIYHLVAEEIGNNKLRTVCGRTVITSKSYRERRDRWLQEIDAWVCNCQSCNNYERSRQK